LERPLGNENVLDFYQGYVDNEIFVGYERRAWSVRELAKKIWEET